MQRNALLGLFLVQFLVSVLFSESVNQVTIVVLSTVYVVAAAVLLARKGRRTAQLVRHATVTSFDVIPEEPGQESRAST